MDKQTALTLIAHKLASQIVNAHCNNATRFYPDDAGLAIRTTENTEIAEALGIGEQVQNLIHKTCPRLPTACYRCNKPLL